MEFSFVTIFLLLSFSITTYSVLHTFPVSTSLLLCKRKKKTTDSCLLPLAIASQGGQRVLQVREKSYSRLLKTHAPGIYLETSMVFLLTPAPGRNSCKGRFHLSVVVLLSRDSVVFLLTPLDTIPVKEGFI